jgi:hypothetical protein
MIPATPYEQAPLPRQRRGPRLRVNALALDDLEIGTTDGAVRIRRWMALFLMVYASILIVRSGMSGRLPSVAYVLMAAVALAVYKNMLGRFLRDWTLVLGGLFAYLWTSHFAPSVHAGVHFRPQIVLDQAIGLGTVPTIWLQEHLYTGQIGALEIFATLAYVSHFFGPVALGLFLSFTRRSRAFGELMFGILLTSLISDVTYLCAPTAPPWLAAEHGYLPPVHHIIKDSLVQLHLGGLAAMDGDPRHYNIVAALPSMHAAFPALMLIIVLRHRLHRLVVALVAFQLLSVTFSIVYTGEHYVVDALAGAAYAGLAYVLVCRGLDHLPRRKAEEPAAAAVAPDAGLAVERA